MSGIENSSMFENGYVLITPARNEEAYIERTIESVLAQTVPPRAWIIVSDGSEDRTEEIVEKAASKANFISLVVRTKQERSSFGSKVKAFRAGYECLGDISYGFIGNLDADVSFAPSYYEKIIEKFQADPHLGLAGGIILEQIGRMFVPQRISRNSVAGAVQLFRRSCYEEIGGYIPIPSGGIDAAAEIMVRTRGWTVRTIPELAVYHHRRVSTGRKRILGTRFHEGLTDYSLGYHPLFQSLRCVYRLNDKPYLFGSMLAMSGYAWGWITHAKRVLPRDVVRLLRSEQLSRIRLVLRNSASVQKDSPA